MELRVDTIEDFAEQCDRCLNHNYTRVRVEDIVGRQKVNWDTYKKFEQAGAILLVTATHDDELVGFALYVTYVHPHHPDAVLGQCQFLIVQPKMRGHGLGKALVEYAMPKLKERGCTHILHGRRMVYDVEPLFPKIGFTKFEETYVKEL